MRLLPQCLDQPPFLAIQRYLKDNPHPLKLYQLAKEIADAFDQYAVFRPDMVMEWDTVDQGDFSGEMRTAERWQMILWRALNAETDYPHRARRHKTLLGKLSAPEKGPAGLSERLMVFGISHLPPYHLQVLEALSRQLPVYLFLLNPCRHYWSDIVSGRHLAQIHTRQGEYFESDNLLHLDPGNRLLASLGQQGREFFHLILQHQSLSLDLFRDNPTQTVLGRIQQDILDLIDIDDLLQTLWPLCRHTMIPFASITATAPCAR